MAAKGIILVKSETHIAIYALRNSPARLALDEEAISSPVEKDYRLLFFFKLFVKCLFKLSTYKEMFPWFLVGEFYYRY